MNSPGIIADPTVPRKRTLPIRYLLVSWLLVLSAVAFLDRTNIAISGVQIRREFGIDNTHLGWVFSAFLIGYAAFQIPGGLLVRRFGPRRILTFSVTWWAAFIILTALVPSSIPGAVLVLATMRFLLGAGEATMYPSTNLFVERWFPMSERGKANGIIFAGVGVGSGFAPPLLTAIVLHFGWRVSFLSCGSLGALAGLVWYLCARDTPEEHPAVSAEELAWIASGRTDEKHKVPATPDSAARTSESRRRVPWGRIFRSRETLGLSAAYFSFGYVAWVFFSWFYIYLAQVRGVNLKTTAIYSMFPFIAMTLGSVCGGIISDAVARRLGPRAGRCYFPALALALTAVLLVIGSHAASAITATLILASGAGALYLSQSCFWSVSADFGGEHAGIVSGAMNSACQIGGAVTATLTPLIAAHLGWNASFLTATVLAALGALAWLAVNPNERLATA